MADEHKIRQEVIIEYPAGMELSKSRKSEDGLSPLVRSADKTKNGVQTQVEIFLKDEGEEASTTTRMPTDRALRPTDRRWEPTAAQHDLIMAAVEHGVSSVLDRIELAIREWVANRPARKAELARGREETATRAAAESEHNVVTAAEVEPHVSPEAQIAEPSSGAEVPTISMTLTQWREALHALLLTHAMSAELWQVLAHARIEGAPAAVLEQQRKMAKLTPEEFEGRVAEMLRAEPGLVDEPLSELLVRLVEPPSSDHQPDLAGDLKATAQLPWSAGPRHRH